MIQRSSVTIDSKEGKKFVQFLNLSAKNKQFWDKVKEGASVRVDKSELDKLFERRV